MDDVNRADSLFSVSLGSRLPERRTFMRMRLEKTDANTRAEAYCRFEVRSNFYDGINRVGSKKKADTVCR